MVFDQPSSLPSDPDSPPNSSPDPYSSTNTDIDFTQLPSPLFFPFSTFTKSSHMSNVRRYLELRAADMNRPLTPEETAAAAYHMAKCNKTVSYGHSVGLLAGAIRAFNTRKNYGFPFAGPMKSENGWFDGERVRILGREIMRGENARGWVSALRIGTYLVLGSLFAFPLSWIYAGVVMSAHELQDPRLKDISAELRERLEKKREITRLLRRKDHRGTVTDGNAEANRDGRNPTGREGEVEYAPNKAPPFRPQPDKESAWTEEDPPFRSSNTTNSSSSGSAWDRIRRDLGSTAPVSNKTRRAPGMRGPETRDPGISTSTTISSSSSEEEEEAGAAPPKSDDFPFSSSELESGYAREEAQRDFDARVERERRGGDFSERQDEDPSERRW